jgi:hypothetical protein
MTTDLDDALRTAGQELHLDRELSAVLSRGDRLRRRRRRVRLGVAGLAVAVVAGGAAVTLTRPHDDSVPVATDDSAWGAHMVNLTGDDLTEADGVCRTWGDESGTPYLPATARLVAGDSRGGVSALLYRYGDEFASCSVISPGPGEHASGGGSFGSHWRPLPGGTHFEDLGGVASVDHVPTTPGGPGGHLSDAVDAIRVSDDVARLVVHVAGQDIETRVGDGLAVCWLPDGILQSDYDAATATAYAADGTELDSGTLLDRLAP